MDAMFILSAILVIERLILGLLVGNISKVDSLKVKGAFLRGIPQINSCQGGKDFCVLESFYAELFWV